MSTAVLISGQMRTFAKCYPTQRWQIFRHYEPDIHFFVSCVDDKQAKSSNLLVADGYDTDIEFYYDPPLPKIPLEKGESAPYANAITHDKLMLQHWGVKKVWDFYQSKTKVQHDTIIRIRPDLWIHRFQKPPDPNHNEAILPWWGKFGGVNDRLAILGCVAAQEYFKVFDCIPELLAKGCPFHPETLTAAVLHGLNIRPLMASFSTERMDGSRRWPEILLDDIAELINGKA